MTRWTEADLTRRRAENPAVRLSEANSRLRCPQTGRESDVSKASSGSIATVQGLNVAQQVISEGKLSKYRARRTVVDGITFASKHEAARYSDLKLLERSGAIRDLQLQPKYPLKVAGKLIATYIADFAYFDAQMLRPVVEDAKGFKTPVYRLKKKLFLALYGESCEFRET